MYRYLILPLLTFLTACNKQEAPAPKALVKYPNVESRSDFKKLVLNAEKPVLVDFWAEWCKPCKRLNPIIDEAHKEMDDVFDVVKVNIDHNAQLATDLQIQYIPTLMVFIDGKLIARTGFMNKTQIQDTVKQSIAHYEKVKREEAAKTTEQKTDKTE